MSFEFSDLTEFSRILIPFRTFWKARVEFSIFEENKLQAKLHHWPVLVGILFYWLVATIELLRYTKFRINVALETLFLSFFYFSWKGGKCRSFFCGIINAFTLLFDVLCSVHDVNHLNIVWILCKILLQWLLVT